MLICHVKDDGFDPKEDYFSDDEDEGNDEEGSQVSVHSSQKNKNDLKY